MKATIARDVNGNRIVKLSPISKRGFSIQTLGNLPLINKLQMGETFESNQNVLLWMEILDYLKEFGTARQKSLFAYFN